MGFLNNEFTSGDMIKFKEMSMIFWGETLDVFHHSLFNMGGRVYYLYYLFLKNKIQLNNKN